MGLGLFCSLGLGFFVSLLEQETIVVHLVDRTNVTVIMNSFILTWTQTVASFPRGSCLDMQENTKWPCYCWNSLQDWVGCFWRTNPSNVLSAWKHKSLWLCEWDVCVVEERQLSSSGDFMEREKLKGVFTWYSSCLWTSFMIIKRVGWRLWYIVFWGLEYFIASF